MSRSDDDRPMIEQIARVYAPPPRGPVQRRAFEAAVRERRERQRTSHGAPLVLAATAAALGLALGATWLAGLRAQDPAAAPVAHGVPSAPLAGALGETLLALAEEGQVEPDAGIPEEYLAIEEFLLEGGV